MFVFPFNQKLQAEWFIEYSGDQNTGFDGGGETGSMYVQTKRYAQIKG